MRQDFALSTTCAVRPDNWLEREPLRHKSFWHSPLTLDRVLPFQSDPQDEHSHKGKGGLFSVLSFRNCDNKARTAHLSMRVKILWVPFCKRSCQRNYSTTGLRCSRWPFEPPNNSIIGFAGENVKHNETNSGITKSEHQGPGHEFLSCVWHN